ncbi:MAG: DUF2071 domain-containing protein [Agriterribacter sp.]
MSEGKSRYYQEWNRALFLHWKIPVETLRPLIPEGITIDTFNGECWLSIVAFTMEKIRPVILPSLGAISNFHEINIRTYVVNNNKPGVYFLSIEAGKTLSVLIAKFLSELPYQKSNIKRTTDDEADHYSSTNFKRGFEFNASFKIGMPVAQKTELEKWLTERYCLYLKNGSKLYRYEIHHKEWGLHHVEMLDLKAVYQIRDFALDKSPDLINYSPGVKVVAWKRAVCK